MKATKLTLLLALITIFVIAIYLLKEIHLGQYLTLDYIKTQQNDILHRYHSKPTPFIAAYMGIYIIVTALSIPGAAIMTLIAGAIFGLSTGTIIVSFASTIGATLAFLIARTLLKDLVQSKWSDKLTTINNGIQKEGPFYLFAIRLVPIFPFFLVNLIMGLTPMRTLTFFWVSQLGMLPGTIAYVNAGKELSKIDTLSSILSPTLLLSFAALGLLPLLSKWTINYIRKHQA